MFSYNRPSLNLDGKWKFCPDPMQRCRRQKWWKNPSSNEHLFPCWDIEGLWEINVPGTWKKQFQELTWYDGHAVYIKDFWLESIPENHEAFLIFDGVVYESEVFLNGEHVGKHSCGYSPFEFRVTDLLDVNNRLFVLVDNHLRPDRIPGEIFDWNNDGGIINSVKLIFVPMVYIKNFRARTKIDSKNVLLTFDIWLDSRNFYAEEKITVAIPELDVCIDSKIRIREITTIQIQVPLSKILLWSPENPKLYETIISTGYEKIKDEIGFREIKTKNSEVLLNDKPIKLYGVSVHSEFKETGRTSTESGIKELIKNAKDLGVNFLRCAHYPYAEIFGRTMDQAGLLWWQEVPAYWLGNIAQKHMTDLATEMLKDTIQRDWNRASLIVWSISNECAWHNPEDENDNNYNYWLVASKIVREMDSSRLLSCAEAQNRKTRQTSWNPNKADEFDLNFEEIWRTGHPDSFYELFDILAGNIYFEKGEGSRSIRNFVNMLKPYNKPLFLSEFGSVSLLDSTCPGDVVGSEEYHCEILSEAYKNFKLYPEIVGYSPWCLCDIRVPIHWRWFNSGKAVFRYGLMDENWQRKKAFETVKLLINHAKATSIKERI